MKKRLKKLTLSRETLGDLRRIGGAGPIPTHAVQCNSDPCGPPGDGGTVSIFGTCNGCGLGSTGCTTGATDCPSVLC